VAAPATTGSGPFDPWSVVVGGVWHLGGVALDRALAVGVPVLVNGRFFFPTRFEATAQGLTATHPTFAPLRIRWDEVDRIVLARPGVWQVFPTKTHRFAKARIMPVYEDLTNPRVASILAKHWEPQS